MGDRSTLFANVLNQPADDTARLVLADWLDEHDEDEFARFLRAGVVAARFRDALSIDDPDYYQALQVISDVTTGGTPTQWLSALGIGPAPLVPGAWVWDNTGDRVTVRIGAVSGVFSRGMLAELVVSLEGWYDLATVALAEWPLERATITNVPGLSFWIEPPDADNAKWRLTAAFTAQQPPARPRGLLRQFAAFFVGSGDNPRPIPVGRWTAERSFLNRATLVRLARDVWPVLFDEVRDAAGVRWTLGPQP